MPPPAPREALDRDAQALQERLELTLEELDGARQEIEALKEQLQDREVALARLEERYAALEMELYATVEEVLRSKANLQSVQSRALATSRIAEVRVELQSLQEAEDPEVQNRVGRARDFLNRADKALEEGNYAGAGFLSERAQELVRQATILREFRSASRSSQFQKVLPIVPPRSLETVVNANLRKGPGTDQARVMVLQKGERILAVARAGDWFHVQTESGLKAWLHRSVVR
ncbi:MAG: SH3 domain-containing protein [Acidobacteriota bacterium]